MFKICASQIQALQDFVVGSNHSHSQVIKYNVLPHLRAPSVCVALTLKTSQMSDKVLEGSRLNKWVKYRTLTRENQSKH